MTAVAEPGLRGPKVCELAGITYRQLDYWIRTGLIAPSIAEGHGSGTQRRFSATDVREVRLVAALMSQGIDQRRIRRALEWLRDVPSARWLVVGSRVDVADDGDLEIVVRTGGGIATVVDLAELDVAVPT